MKPLVVIPARLGSTRFPRKVLKNIHGKPVLQWVVEGIGDHHTVIATPDQELVERCDEWDLRLNVQARKTLEAPTVLDTCSQIARRYLRERDPIIVVQGDEPMVKPDMVADAIRFYDFHGDLCLVKPISPGEAEDLNTVKVITDKDMNIWYMSRYPIPGQTPEGDGEYGLQQLKQVCVMAFASRNLAQFGGWPRSGVERSEGIDLLRFLHRGMKIKAISSYVETHAVDVPEDIPIVEQLMEEGGYV